MLKLQHASYTMSLEEYKSALDMFQMKTNELITRIKSTQNETIQARYQEEIENLKQERQVVIRLIESDKKDRAGVAEELKRTRQQIHKMRQHVKTLRLDAKQAEDAVSQAIMSQTGSESMCEKKKIQAQQKQIEAEKFEQGLLAERETRQEKISAKQLKVNAHELNQKESEEVIQQLMKRKQTVEGDSSIGNKEEILNTINSEIATETTRANEEKASKEALQEEIRTLTDKTQTDERKAKTTKEEAASAMEDAQESCEENASAMQPDTQELAFLEEAAAKEEERQAILDELDAIKEIYQEFKQFQSQVIDGFEAEMKAVETRQSESEAIIDSLYTEIKNAKNQMQDTNIKSTDIVQL